MSVLSNQPPSPGICLLCYKTINHSIKSDDSLENINRFIEILRRFVKFQHSEAVLLKKLSKRTSDIASLLECCDKCKTTIIECSAIFYQLKTLELQLDWKIVKLASVINHANKVPARWVNFNKVLGEHCQDDLGKKVTSRRVIRELRENIVKAADQRRLQSQPRVLLKRIETPAQFNEPSVSESTKSVSNETTSEAFKFTNAAKPRLENYVETTKLNEKFSEANSQKSDEDNFVCLKCGRKFSTFNGLQLHKRIHKGAAEWTWECHQCGKRFRTKINLGHHTSYHTRTNAPTSYTCRFCGIKFPQRTPLIEHLNKYHGNEGEDLQTELNRNWDFISIDTLGNRGQDKDNNQNDEDPLSQTSNISTNANLLETAAAFQDPLIEVKFEHFALVPNMASSASMAGQGISRECIANGVTSLGNESLSPKKFPCKKCGTQLKTADTLKKHMEYHKKPEEWKWKCEKCTRRFVDSDTLRLHLLRKHEKKGKKLKKAFKCQYCDNRYATKRYVNEHVDKVHWKETGGSEKMGRRAIKSLEAKFECKICTRKFTSCLKNEFHFSKCHDLKGNIERETFKCTKEGCTAYFLRRIQLHIHGKLEHGEISEMERMKIFKCRFCQKGYDNQKRLERHLKDLHWKGLKRQENGKGRKGKKMEESDESNEDDDSDEEAESDYEAIEIENLILEERLTCSNKRNEYEDGMSGPHKLVDDDNGSEEIKRELINKSVLIELEIDEGNVANNENEGFNETTVDDENTFGRKRGRHDDGYLAGLEDLD